MFTRQTAHKYPQVAKTYPGVPGQTRSQSTSMVLFALFKRLTDRIDREEASDAHR